tara:strand:+ start:106 stop:360 length:255 start_codon:yes stop_codon:yes gene_type:complete
MFIMSYFEKTSYTPFAVGNNVEVLKTVRTTNAREVQREISLLKEIVINDSIAQALASDTETQPQAVNLLDIQYRFNGEPVYLQA